MRIEVDRTRCQALGMCESLQPAYFQVGDDANLHVLREDVPAEDLAGIEHAVDQCPTGALSLRED